MKKYQLISGILAIICMIVIFGFSAQPSDDSGEVSGVVSVQIVKTANKWFRWNMNNEKIREMADRLEPILRKIAHAAEYGLLAVLLFLFFDHKEWRLLRHAAVTIGISYLYAVSDELHQLFVPGRHGCAADVMIDGTGAVVAVLCLIGVRKCISFLWKKNKYPESGSSFGAAM